MLTVTAPSSGTQHAATLTGTGAEFRLKENVPSGTAFSLGTITSCSSTPQARPSSITLPQRAQYHFKRGTNTYDIVTRDSAGTILDRVTYTIILNGY